MRGSVGGGAEKEGEGKSLKLTLLPVRKRDVRLHPATLRSGPEPKSRVGHLTDQATQAPSI